MHRVSGAVNTQGFVRKLSCAIHTFFIHSSFTLFHSSCWRMTVQTVVIVTEVERRLGPVVWLSVERFVQSPDIVGQSCRVLFAVYSLL